MEKVLMQYCTGVALLRGRIGALRQEMKNPKLTPLELQSLEARRRLLSEEAHEMEQSMEIISQYATAEQAGKAGGLDCA